MNSQILKSLILLNDGTQQNLAKAMNLSVSRLNAKINKTKAEFTQSEMAFIRDRYKLSKEQVIEIFFNN